MSPSNPNPKTSKLFQATEPNSTQDLTPQSQLVACQCHCQCSNTFTPPPVFARINRQIPLTCTTCATQHKTTPENTPPPHTDRAQRHQWDRIWKSRVPLMFQQATSGHPDVNAVLVQAQKGEPAGLLLTGPVGTGKTHRAYALLNALVSQGISHPENIIVGRESLVLAEAVHGSWESRETTKRALSNPNLKVAFIDDAGHSSWRTAEDRWSLWTDLTDRILINHGILIVTTNLSADKLSEWVGQPATHRLRALTRGTATILNDIDYRSKKFLEENNPEDPSKKTHQTGSL